ncbi:SprT-like domain-containing protein [Aquiluna borgnonia]|uniref:SprT-like domain-containing protein n=1 Tax=Aquiluna borgnonia TaxID=2499157 RepID=A0A7D4UK57_9MICO|nr:SprT-like domain-containing protein [Aquiluna borgnonia]
MFSEVSELADQLFQRHGLINYSFGFDRAVRRAGLCNYSKRRITISRHLVQVSEIHQIEQVLLHEIAHALCGQQAGHGPIWRAKATELGYLHQRIDGNAIAKSSAKYRGLCPQGHEHFRSRRPSRALSCKGCAPVFSRRYLISWQEIS